MITQSQEYYNNLWRIESPNPPHLAILIPGEETVYNIDLNTRTIDAPEYLSVEQDHKSEIIYFKVDRYYEAMDLADTVCIIQYTNKTTGRSGCYAVPFYDTITYSTNEVDENYKPKILFPWCIDALATEKAGQLEYAIKFFKVADNNTIVYTLNTVPAVSKILKGLNPEDNEESLNPNASILEQLLNRVQILENDYTLYWDIIN